MNRLPTLLLPALMLLAPLVVAQEETDAAQDQPPQINSFEMERDVWQNLGDEARDEQAPVRKHPDAEIVPAGWIDDFDYASAFAQYLAPRVAQATEAGKQLHLYLYADWLEPCQEFRRTVARQDYAELFENHEIVMVDYWYFVETFGMKFRNLPVLIRVHADGKIGPENLHPVSRRAEHPAKAFNRVRKYLLADR